MNLRDAILKMRDKESGRDVIKTLYDSVSPLCRSSLVGLLEWLSDVDGYRHATGDESASSIAAEWDVLQNTSSGHKEKEEHEK